SARIIHDERTRSRAGDADRPRPPPALFVHEQSERDQPSQTSSKRSSSDDSGTMPFTLGFIQYRWISLLKTISEPSSWNQRTSSGYIFLRAAGLAVKRKASRRRSASSDLKPVKFHGEVECCIGL